MNIRVAMLGPQRRGISVAETVTLALITAGSGFLGALAGAAASVVGPWWLQGIDQKRNYLESRRLAIIDFGTKKMDAMREYRIVFDLGGKSDNLSPALGEANKSATALYSLIRKEDAAVKDWINKMGFRAIALKPKTPKDLARADAFLGVGIQCLLAWHTGELSTAELRPFGLDETGERVWLANWNTPWPD